MSSFGSPREISGGAFTGKSTAVPYDFLQDVLSDAPIPITISGTNQVIFTVNASSTNPVKIWNGNDYIKLTTSSAYTWTANTNNILSTAAAETTQTGSTAGVWYFYMGIDSSGNIDLLPSTVEPKFVEGPYEGGHFCHPGTSRGQFWSYVGFQVCSTATTPVFVAHTKVGKTYHRAATSVATTTTWTERDFSAHVPKHGPLGLTVAGHLETGAEGSVTIGSTSSATLGVQVASIAINTTTHTAVLKTPFSNIVPTANGKVWSNDTVARGDVHISAITDVV